MKDCLFFSKTIHILLVINLKWRITLVVAKAAVKYINLYTLSPVPSLSNVRDDDYQDIIRQELFGYSFGASCCC